MNPQPEFNLTQALVDAEDGIALTSLSNAEWLEVARHMAETMAGGGGTVTADDLRPFLKLPKSPAAWGAIFRTDGWKCIGWTRSTLVSNHGRMIRKWAIA